MRVSVLGCGYLGAVHSAALAVLGHDVVGIDVDPDKVEQLDLGRAPFYEPGLPELLARGRATGRLRFTTDVRAAAGATVHFVCVGTPQLADGEGANMEYVRSAVDALGVHLHRPALVVGKSTVPVGTAASLATRLREIAPAGDQVEALDGPGGAGADVGVPAGGGDALGWEAVGQGEDGGRPSRGVRLCRRDGDGGQQDGGQGTAERGREPLLTLGRHRRIGGKLVFGQNLVPLNRGTIRVGDTVTILD